MEKAFLKIFLKSILMIFILCTWTGCSNVGQKLDNFHASVENKMISFQQRLVGEGESEPGTDKSESEKDWIYFKHVTKWPSENFACVAQWYTGDPKNAKILAKANPKMDPEKIAVGTTVLIPDNLVRNRKDLPKEFAGRFDREYFKHTVRWPGESLSLIARWYTGSSKNWRVLARANPHLNPNRIKSGNRVYIPPERLVTRKPLPQKLAAKYTSTYFAHTVKNSNEKLGDIAKWYTGKTENWEALAQANPRMDPENLTVGTEIFIPAKLLKTRKPIPTDANSKLSGQQPKKSGPSDAAAPQKQDKTIRLFGPKQFPKG